jgi:hypothetical protein
MSLWLFWIWSLAMAATVSSADYWPLNDGLVYHYESDTGGRLEVSFGWGMRECCYSHWDTCWTWEYFETDGSGDVLLWSNTHYWQGAIDPDYAWTFNPPVTFLDLPLAVGKTWSTWTLGLRSGYEVIPCHFSFEVVASQTVVVPLGTFEVLVLVETAGCNHGGTYYLHRQLGPVILPGGYKLVSVAGLVAAESGSWGRLKALYR